MAIKPGSVRLTSSAPSTPPIDTFDIYDLAPEGEDENEGAESSRVYPPAFVVPADHQQQQLQQQLPRDPRDDADISPEEFERRVGIKRKNLRFRRARDPFATGTTGYAYDVTDLRRCCATALVIGTLWYAAFMFLFSLGTGGWFNWTIIAPSLVAGLNTGMRAWFHFHEETGRRIDFVEPIGREIRWVRNLYILAAFGLGGLDGALLWLSAHLGGTTFNLWLLIAIRAIFVTIRARRSDD